ncbi:macrophage mannose receptor 1-like [Mya arenaria]|uniref:macrophage mannose receptor 1-like n=1 Tax=Mya arenaria TaxID=6604 RepID=UPI0022E75DC0|nr:macrophage mannose receptor 1-like [Mya arenaria]
MSTFFVVICVSIVSGVNMFALTRMNISLSEQDINGHSLKQLGDEAGLSALSLIGQALINLENKTISEIEDSNLQLRKQICDINKCEPWSKWSNCSALSQGSYGIRTRARTCWDDGGICDKTGSGTIENQSEVCSGLVCPVQYEMVSKFCFKIHTRHDMTRNKADEECKKDGGHIINVDTQERFDILVQKYSEIGLDNTWTDGKRNIQAGPWIYERGGDPMKQSFFKWGSDDPDNASTDLCKRFEISNKQWFDTNCNAAAYSFVCEIRS